MKSCCKEKGFTLIEIIIVCVIVGFLAAMAIPRFLNFRKDAERAAEEATIGAVQSGINITNVEGIVNTP